MISKLKKMSSRKVLFIGLLLTAISCNKSDQNYIETDGTIIKIEKKDILKKEPGYIVIEYTDNNGKKRTGNMDYDHMKIQKVNDKITILYSPNSPSEIIEIDKSKKQKRFVTYALLIVTILIIMGTIVGYFYAMKKGKEFRYKPIFLILVVILFFVSLYATITGQTYDEIISFIK